MPQAAGARLAAPGENAADSEPPQVNVIQIPPLAAACHNFALADPFHGYRNAAAQEVKGEGHKRQLTLREAPAEFADAAIAAPICRR
jgi:hypothetical protein